MSTKEKLQYLGPVAETFVYGLAAAVIGGMGIVLYAHRLLTHRSIDLPESLQKAIEFEQRTYGLDANVWAAAHRGHHKFPDATLAPQSKIAQAVNWMRGNREQTEGVTIPRTFSHLDPYVPSFGFKDVMKIGDMAIKEMKQTMGDRYQEPKSYTRQQLEAILNPREPQYWYPKQMCRPYTQDDIAEMILGDLHSPVRVGPPEGNGVRFILKGTTGVYEHLTHLYTAHPEFMPEDLQHADGKARKYGWPDFALGFAIPSLAFLLTRGAYTPKDILGATLKGSTVNAIRLLALYFGGKVVNALGHGGEEGAQVMKILGSSEYQPRLNPDGTITTGTAIKSVIGRIASLLTFDEVGGQGAHHEDESRIAYTDKEGIQRWEEAPFGSFIHALARSEYFPLIKVGDNFNLTPGERRPDQVHQAVQIIQRLRAEQLAAQLS